VRNYHEIILLTCEDSVKPWSSQVSVWTVSNIEMEVLITEVGRVCSKHGRDEKVIQNSGRKRKCGLDASGSG